MDDLKQLFKDNYLKYASYVILERAIPHIVDGLKPVQRRILWTLFQMDDGKLHKVANAAGQTMALHPHGDAPITEALVHLANRGYLLDRQGNFGNPATGDPHAAARYIETRLSALAKETLFNPALTPFTSSYDGRAQEPITLPAKIPLLLLQGSEGIAVGMSTKIFPHNFCELIKAQIALIEGKPIKLVPDFSSGGIMDASEYSKGQGKIKLRAKIISPDDKTLVIKEICHGTTTESLIRSIDDAAKKGKIKIDAINDYTAERVEIEIKLPRGHYAKNLIDALYAFTECEVTLHSQIIVIKDNTPCEMSVDEVLSYQVELLIGYLKKELEIERDRLLEKIFEKTLEQIFIENRLYKKIETVASLDKIHSTIEASLVPFHSQLSRIPTKEDREKLLAIPIRRISRFDCEKNQEEIVAIQKRLGEIERHLKSIKKFTVKYLSTLLENYGELFPRRTQIREIETLDVKEIARRKVKVGYDAKTGYLGTKISGEMSIECTNFDKLLVLYENGTYSVINIPEKHYVHAQEGGVALLAVADKKTPICVCYADEKTKHVHIKRFIVKQFILDKVYPYLSAGQKLICASVHPQGCFELIFKPGAKTKKKKLILDMEDVPIKGTTAKGESIALTKEIKSITECDYE